MVAWTLVFHILGFVFWIGGLLIATNMLGRHAQASSPEVRAAFGDMEMTLLKGMANPGALLAVITGVVLILTNRSYYLRAGWLHGKLVLVAVLLILHGVVFSRAKQFIAGRVEVQRREWMTLHGAIALIFLGILVCVLPVQALLR